MEELKNWKEINKGYYRYVIASNVAYEIFIEYWQHETPIETAKASLCIVGDWHTKDRKSITNRDYGIESGVFRLQDSEKSVKVERRTVPERKHRGKSIKR